MNVSFGLVPACPKMDPRVTPESEKIDPQLEPLWDLIWQLGAQSLIPENMFWVMYWGSLEEPFRVQPASKNTSYPQ